MAIITDIIGNGNVEIVEDETSAILNAVPVLGYDFKHFVIEGKEITQNPYLISQPTEDLTVQAVFYESINSYLQGCAPFDISGFIPGVLRGRDVSYKEDLNNMEAQTIELCEADLYIRMTKIPSSRQHESDSDNGWSHNGGSITISDSYRTMLTADALAIYNKYEDEKAKEVQASNENKKTIVEYTTSRAEATKQPIKVIINLL